jgi:Protein of unknown function (DUF2793)
LDETPNLALPYLAPAQAQKHVTVNESLRKLDALVQIAVLDRDLAAPPGSAENGARYIVAVGASGAWAGREQSIAASQDGAWFFHAPRAGWVAWVKDESLAVVWDGAAWALLSPDAAALFGINTTADSTNRLAVSSPAVLFNHEGEDSQVKVNKHAAGDTASVLFQTNFSGRAEFGLTGDDDFHLKVSADGSAWTNAVTFNRSTGVAAFAADVSVPDEAFGTGWNGSLEVPTKNAVFDAVRERLSANRTFYVRTDGSDSNTGLANTSGGAFLTLQKALDVAAALDCNTHIVTIQLADGTYTYSDTTTVWACVGQVGPSGLIIQGNETTPANVVLNCTGGFAACLKVPSGAMVTVRKLKLAAASGYGFAVPGGHLIFDGVDFGACGQSHMYCESGIIEAYNAYAISGGSGAHWNNDNGYIKVTGGPTVTLAGTPNFSSAFARANLGGGIFCFDITFSGAATGVRYATSTNGAIQTYGAGATYLPGDAGGSGDYS